MRIARRILVAASMVAGGILSANTIPYGLAEIYRRIRPAAPPELTNSFHEPFAVAATAVFGAIVLGLASVSFIAQIERMASAWKVMETYERVTVFAAVLAGVALSIPFHMLFFTLGTWAVIAGIALMLLFIALSHSMLKGMEDALPWSRNAGGRKRSHIKIFDTNVIIDGRIYEVAKAGFLEGKLYIPDFVLKELQAIADSHEPNRRQRGRRGLDMLKNLQRDFEFEVGTQDKHAGDSGDVDARLVRLAKALGATLVTNDYNLNKVAQVHGVPVMNINDLALAMRPQYLPNDHLAVKIEREGSQPGQGVAFLDDGTMVVVEDGADLIGQKVDVRISQIHQSAAGRMLFGNLNGEAEIEEARRKQRR
ncbi:TRAM domain-containing protein [Fimbriimonadia bacterium ATM]|nr:TRAM domain-containing protein [Fimbriimonadia bacterium ATM]